MAFEPADFHGEIIARLLRRARVPLQFGDGVGGFLCKIIAAALERRDGALLQIVDLAAGGFEPLPFLSVLRHRHRERASGALEGAGGVAHLLVEKRQGVLVGEALLGRMGAAPQQSYYGLEHLRSPAMNIVHIH